uniref:Uncharacterized protein n=1 Tax=Nicotiana tabacum TaxID=4097 RepID=A0A1S4B3B9_TOBAC|nr:uncharacterized protein LOC104088746 [Nicotiana tomentosiformis]XP_016483288.1 PREDICTED: uncharacterized protein LOC107803996 [Nicotiana tabacum]
MTEDEWVKESIIDDIVVAELLLCLNQVASIYTPNSKPPIQWSVRQRRSNLVSVNTNNLTLMASPRTPLSWSGATSVSGGGGGSAIDVSFAESSRSSSLQTTPLHEI